MHTITTYDPAYNAFKNTLRLCVAAIFALFVTLGLLFLMQRLITTDLPEPTPTMRPVIPDIYHKDIVIESKPTVRTIEKIDTVELPPKFERLNVEADSSNLLTSKITTSVEATELNIDVFESDTPIRIVTFHPHYPSNAANRDIEGYVDIMFDINEMGLTENLRIIHAEPKRVFNKSALNAIKRWKYAPAIKDGKPQRQDNMMERVRFQLEKKT